MGRSCPPNLTHSTAYLTDKPYDVQLGVLRWIRGLLSEVVDEATTQLSTTATRIERESGQQGNHDDHDTGCDTQMKDSLPPDTQTRTENKPPEHTQDEEGLSTVKSQDVEDRGSGESVRIFKTEAAETRATMDENDGGGTTSAHDAAAADTADGDGGSTGVSRKRPRTPTLKNSFGVGSVVECYHPVSNVFVVFLFCRCRLSGRQCGRVDTTDEQQAVQQSKQGFVI